MNVSQVSNSGTQDLAVNWTFGDSIYNKCLDLRKQAQRNLIYGIRQSDCKSLRLLGEDIFVRLGLMNLQEAAKILLDHKRKLRRLFKINRLGIFGSYAKGKQKKRSDIDILVEFAEPIGMIQFVSAQNYMADLLGIKVDLVSKNALRPSMREQIIKETKYL